MILGPMATGFRADDNIEEGEVFLRAMAF